jgi:hypothetical protein
MFDILPPITSKAKFISANGTAPAGRGRMVNLSVLHTCGHASLPMLADVPRSGQQTQRQWCRAVG